MFYFSFVVSILRCISSSVIDHFFIGLHVFVLFRFLPFFYSVMFFSFFHAHSAFVDFVSFYVVFDFRSKPDISSSVFEFVDYVFLLY